MSRVWELITYIGAAFCATMAVRNSPTEFTSAALGAGFFMYINIMRELFDKKSYGK